MARPNSVDLLLVGYLSIVFLSVIAFGSARSFPLSLACSSMAALTLFAIAVRGVPEQVRRILALCAILLLSSLVWAIIQAGPAALLHEFGHKSAQLAAAISFQPADTIFSAQFIAYPMLTYMAGLLIVRSDKEARRLTTWLSLVAAALIVATLVQFLLIPSYVLTGEKQFYKDSFTATFINRNTAGTFVGLAILLLLRQLWSAVRGFTTRDLLSCLFFWRNPTNQPLAKVLTYGSLLAVALVALFLTKSRGAIFSTLLALAIFASILLWFRQSAHRSGYDLFKHFFVRLLALIAVSLFFLAIVGDRVAMRTEAIGTNEPRLCVLPGVMATLTEHMWVGAGGGTFEAAFARHRDPQCGLMGVWEKAHNTYLESWIEFGILGPLLAITMIGCLLFVFVASLLRGQRQRSYAALGVAAVILVSVHASVDFSLEIPGLSAFFATIVVAGTVIAKQRPDGDQQSQ